MLSEYNRLLETKTCTSSSLPATIWHDWLWKCDPQEKISVKCPVNKHHLLGMLVARFRAKFQYIPPDIKLCNVLNDSLLIIVDTPVMQMTFRELKDSVDNLQIAWRKHIHSEDGIKAALELLFCRFGEIISERQSEEVLDDPQCWDVMNDVDEGSRSLNIPSIRKMIDVFLILFRQLSLFSVAQDVMSDWTEHEINMSLPIEIRRHHVSASIDNFYSMSMFYDLLPGARLQYMHEFSGMYNSVTQVVYFHDQDYERQRQITLDEIVSGERPVNFLPCFLQLYPEVRVMYEDDLFVSILPGKKGDGKWYWLLISGAIFLLTPKGKVLHSDNMIYLANTYIQLKNQADV